jgi:hypothetical protein
VTFEQGFLDVEQQASLIFATLWNSLQTLICMVQALKQAVTVFYCRTSAELPILGFALEF